MLLYSVNENGSLKKITKLSYAATAVFVIDDDKTIYVWNGQKATKKKREFGVKTAEKLNKEKNVTIIAATHDLKIIDVSDCLFWLRDGKIERTEMRNNNKKEA